MKVYKTIIHQIEKERLKLSAKLSLSNDLLNIDSEVENLIERLNNAFSQESRIIRTEFQDLEKHYFKNDLTQSLTKLDGKDSFTDISFKTFSEVTIENLRMTIKNHPFALGGYYVYSHYEAYGRNYLAIYIVRDTEKVIFTRDPIKGVFVVNTTNIIDTDKLSMACRIDLDKFEKGTERYLQFTNYRQQEISDYFVNWLEASQVNKIAEDTKTFIKIIDNVDLPIDPETEKVYDEDKFRSSIHRVVSSSGGILRLKDIGSQFWDDENYLLDYIERNGIDINGEFRVSKTIFKRLNKFELSAGKIKLSFSKGEWSKGTVKTGDINQIIIESPELRNKLDNLINGDND